VSSGPLLWEQVVLLNSEWRTREGLRSAPDLWVAGLSSRPENVSRQLVHRRGSRRADGAIEIRNAHMEGRS